MLDKIISSIAPIAQVRFPRADMRVVLTKGNMPHNDYIAIEVNLINAGMSRESIKQFMAQFDRTFRRTPDALSYAMDVTYEMPFCEVAVVLYLGEDYFREEANR